MGNIPGLMPGVVIEQNSRFRQVSALFESCGMSNEYFPSPLEKDYESRIVLIWNSPPDTDPERVADFIYDNLVMRDMYSDKDVKPKVHVRTMKQCFSILFPTKVDAENALGIHNLLSYQSVQLDMRPFRRKTDIAMLPKYAIEYHPARIIVSNIDASLKDSFPYFICMIIPIDGLFFIEELNDSCLIDVQPPLTPEAACIMIQEHVFGSNQLLCKPFRQLSVPETQNDGQYNVLREDVDIQQILNRKITITNRSKKVNHTGRTLVFYNIIPKTMIKDSQDNPMIVDSIKTECQKYGIVEKCYLNFEPSHGLNDSYGVAIVVFRDNESAESAQISLSGRMYLGRIIITSIKD